MRAAGKHKLIGAVLGVAAVSLLILGVWYLRSYIWFQGSFRIQRQVEISGLESGTPTVTRWPGRLEETRWLLEGQDLRRGLFAPAGIDWHLPLTFQGKIELRDADRNRIPVESEALDSAILSFASGDQHLGPLANHLGHGRLEADDVYWKNIIVIVAVGLVWLAIVGLFAAFAMRQYRIGVHLAGGCPRCGYSRKGLPEGEVCPECGTEG